MEDADIRTAMEAEKEFVKDHDCITAYEQHQKYLRDKYARESFLIKEGRKEGIKEGEARGLAKAVNALKKKGKIEQEIAELLDLDIAKVSELIVAPH